MRQHTAQELVHRYERALLARQRYVRQDPERIDQAIEHQLTNFVLLLEEMARDAGVTRVELDDAAYRATVIAEAEWNLQL